MTPPNPSSEIPPPAVMPPLGPWLEAYVQGDQQAFTQLVGNTTPLVMAAALRRCCGRHALAQEAAQVVYGDLARRAPSLWADATLTGWLHQRATRGMKMETLELNNPTQNCRNKITNISQAETSYR